MSKIYSLLLIVIFTSLPAYSQTVKIGNVDASAYPKITAEITIKDATGTEIARPYDLTKITLKDNNIVRPVSNIQCSPSKKLFSITFVIDGTGTMSNTIDGNSGSPIKTNVAKAAAINLINKLPIGGCEAQLMTFTTQTQLKYPITFIKSQTDIDNLKTEVNKIGLASGGTNFETSLEGKNIGNPFLYVPGVLAYTEQSLYKPIVIFLTDGEPTFDGAINVAGCLDSCNRFNIAFFVVGLGFDVSSSPNISSIANGSKGGKVFSNLLLQTDVDDAFDAIFGLAQQGSPAPCTVDFTTDCSGGNLDVTYNALNNPNSTKAYTIPDSVKPKIIFDQAGMNFPNVNPGTPKTLDLKITAKNNFIDIPINADTYNPSDGFWKVVDWGGTTPFQLTKGQSRTIKVQYSPTDSLCHKADLTILGSMCTGNPIPLQAGYIYAKPIDAGLSNKNVTSPYSSASFCNNSCSPIIVKSVVKGGNFASEYTVGASVALPKTLNPGECLTITGNFTPTDKGLRDATYTVTLNDNTPYTAPLTGTGGGVASIEVTKFIFPDRKCGDTTICVPVKNKGSLVLNITNVTASSTADFDIVSFPPSVPALGEDCIKIKFKPNGTPGLKTVTLTIASSSDGQPNTNLDIEGYEVNLGYQVKNSNNVLSTGSKIDFDTLCPGESKSKVFVIENLGDNYKVSANLTGTDYKIDLNKNNISLTKGNNDSISVTLSSLVETNYNSTLTIVDECTLKTTTINLVGVVAAPKAVLTSALPTFTASIGSSDTIKTLTVRNSSKRNALYHYSNSNTQFSVSTLPPTLNSEVYINAGQTITFQIIFTPVAGGKTTDSLIFSTTSCNDSLFIPFTSSAAALSVDLSIDSTYKSFAGDNDYSISIHLRNKMNFQFNKAKEIVGQIQYLASVLTINAPEFDKQVGKNNIYDFKLKLDGTDKDQDFTFKFTVSFNKASLDSSTPIQFIPIPRSDDNLITVNTKDGLLKLQFASASIKHSRLLKAVGDVFDYPVTIVDTSSQLHTFNKGVTSHIKFNATVLQPISVPKGKVSYPASDPGIATIDFIDTTLFATTGKEYIISTIKFKALLGDADSTKIIVENTNTWAGSVTITNDTSVVKITGLCIGDDGSPRLFNPFGPSLDPPATPIILPNPSTATAILDLNPRENGKYIITIENSIGQLFNSIEVDVDILQNYKVPLNIENLPNGIYWVVIHSPNTILSTQLNLVK